MNPTDGENLVLWASSAEVRVFAVGAAIILTSFLCRRVVGRWLVSLLAHLLEALSMPLSDAVRDSLEKPSRIIVVATAAMSVAKHVLPTGFVSDVINHLIVSILIISVFGVWYRLSGSVVEALSPLSAPRIGMETGWSLRVTRLVIVVACFAAVLGEWGIEIGSALTGVGVLGAGLAIASQDLLRNLIAGMSNINEERFEVGDWVEVVGLVEGTVKRVDLRSTTILGLDRVPHYIPNAELANTVLLNKTRRDHRRVYRTFHLALSTTVEQINEIEGGLRNYLETSGDFVIDDDIDRLVHVEGISESAIDLTVYAFTRTNRYVEFTEVCDRLTLETLRLVRQAGAEIAYPTRTVFVNPSAADRSR